MAKLQVLIVGASIAGPTAAYWFAKAGAHVTVIERFPQLRTNGQTIDIRLSGVNVMRKMPGMEAAVRAKLSPLEGMSFVNKNGRRLGTIRATGDPDQQSLVSEYEVFRGDLGQILFDMTKDNKNIKYVFGEQVASMQHAEKDNGPVTVNFANGLSPATYDLVVACDGGTSRTRALGFECGLRDFTHSSNCWTAYFTMKKDLLKGSKIGHAYTAPGGRFFAIGPDPSGANRVTFMCMNDADATSRLRDAMKKGDDALKEFVAQHYKGAGWIVDDVLDSMMQPNDFYATEIFQVKLPSLSKGRFVLVGDAGYAPGFTGAGTTLAMTGAYLLAGEIGKHNGDIAAGLAGYEKQMRPIITDLQTVPPGVQKFVAPQTAGGISLRNSLFALITWTRILEFGQKFLGGAFSKSDKHPLPEYEWVE